MGRISNFELLQQVNNMTAFSQDPVGFPDYANHLLN